MKADEFNFHKILNNGEFEIYGGDRDESVTSTCNFAES